MFDCLTWSEARYIEKPADADVIRNRLVEAGLKGGPGTYSGGPKSVIGMKGTTHLNKRLFGELVERMIQMNEIARGERAPSRE